MSPPAAPELPAWYEPGAAIVVEPDERELWADATREREEFAKEHPFFEDEALVAYLQGVADGLLPASLPTEMPRPRVYLVRAPELHAAAAPDGSIFITTGGLAALGDEAQLAALFGHEIGHLLERHTLIEHRYRARSTSTAARMAISRAQEEEADRLGVELMRAAGYDPSAAVEMMERVAAESGEARSPVPHLESHPFVGERIRELRPLARREASQPSRRERARYEAAIVPLLLLTAEDDLAAGRLPQARAAIDRHLRLRPESGHGYYLRGEHARRTLPEGRRAPAVRRDYERALELAPEDPDALRALAFLYREDGENDRAHELFSRYLRAAPEAPDRKLIERYLTGVRAAGPDT